MRLRRERRCGELLRKSLVRGCLSLFRRKPEGQRIRSIIVLEGSEGPAFVLVRLYFAVLSEP